VTFGASRIFHNPALAAAATVILRCARLFQGCTGRAKRSRVTAAAVQFKYGTTESRYTAERTQCCLWRPPLRLPHYASPFLASRVAYGISYGTLVASVLFYRLSPFHPLSKHSTRHTGKAAKIMSIFWVFTAGMAQLLGQVPFIRTVLRFNQAQTSSRFVMSPQFSLNADELPKSPSMQWFSFQI
jgi:hypothetical protein